MEVSGKVKVIDSTKEVGTSGFKKRDIVITTDEQYPQDIQIQFVQDKCDVLDKYKVGQNVTIGINLRGREWENPKGEKVYFNTIQGWNIKEVAGEETQEVHEAEVLQSQPADDLPF